MKIGVLDGWRSHLDSKTINGQKMSLTISISQLYYIGKQQER